MHMSVEDRRNTIDRYINILKNEIKRIDFSMSYPGEIPSNMRRQLDAKRARLVKELEVLRRAYALAEREWGSDRDRALAALAHFGLSLPQDDGDAP